MSNRESNTLVSPGRQKARKLRADEVLAELERAQKVFTESKRRVDGEHDAAQDRGEFKKRSKPNSFCAEELLHHELGLAHNDCPEARIAHAAEKAQPSITRRTIDAIRRLVYIWLPTRGK